MRLFTLTRYLMNAADSSPGGGAVPAASATPAAGTPPATPAAAPAQANGNAPDAAALTAAEKKGRDAAFAELRRNGALKKSYLSQTRTVDTNTQQQPPREDADLRKLDRALSRSGLGTQIKTDRAYERLELAFANEAPEDVDGWLKEYFGDFGAAPQTAAPPPAAAATNPSTPPAPATARPASDRGAPATSQVPPEEVNLVTASADDRAALIKSKGLRWYTDTLRSQMRGRRIQVRK